MIVKHGQEEIELIPVKSGVPQDHVNEVKQYDKVAFSNQFGFVAYSLGGSVSNSNKEILERFHSKMLRTIKNRSLFTPSSEIC